MPLSASSFCVICFWQCRPHHFSGTASSLGAPSMVSCGCPLIWPSWPVYCSLFTSLVPLPVHVLQLCFILSTQLFLNIVSSFRKIICPYGFSFCQCPAISTCMSLTLPSLLVSSLVLKIIWLIFTLIGIIFNLVSTTKWFLFLSYFYWHCVTQFSLFIIINTVLWSALTGPDNSA